MNNFDGSLRTLQHNAAEHLDAGRKEQARELLREALELDRNNLVTWELLWRAANTTEEEIISLKRILRINAKHVAARTRLAVLQPSAMSQSDSQPVVRSTTARRPTSRRRRQQQQATILLALLGALIFVVCVS